MLSFLLFVFELSYVTFFFRIVICNFLFIYFFFDLSRCSICVTSTVVHLRCSFSVSVMLVVLGLVRTSSAVVFHVYFCLRKFLFFSFIFVTSCLQQIIFFHLFELLGVTQSSFVSSVIQDLQCLSTFVSHIFCYFREILVFFYLSIFFFIFLQCFLAVGQSASLSSPPSIITFFIYFRTFVFLYIPLISESSRYSLIFIASILQQLHIPFGVCQGW